MNCIYGFIQPAQLLPIHVKLKLFYKQKYHIKYKEFFQRKKGNVCLFQILTPNTNKVKYENNVVPYS